MFKEFSFEPTLESIKTRKVTESLDNKDEIANNAAGIILAGSDDWLDGDHTYDFFYDWIHDDELSIGFTVDGQTIGHWFIDAKYLTDVIDLDDISAEVEAAVSGMDLDNYTESIDTTGKFVFQPSEDLLSLPGCSKYSGKTCNISGTDIEPQTSFDTGYYTIRFDDGSELSAVSGACLKKTQQPLAEGATKLVKGEGGIVENGSDKWKVLAQNNDYTAMVKLNDNDEPRDDSFVVAWALDKDGTWGQGHYFTNKNDAMKFFNARNKTEAIDTSKPVTDLYGYEVTMTNEPPASGSLWLRITRNNQSKPEYYSFLNNAKVKECYKEIVSGVVEPADISDIALGFTTVDGDPQLRWQDYADNFTPYRKPEIEESAMRMSDDYRVGIGDDGKMYHGIASAIDAIKGIVTKSGDTLYVQNISLADNVTECDKSRIVEDKELSEDPSEALSQLGYKQTRNANGEILYHSDEQYSPDISVFGSLIEIIPLSSEDLPISMTVEDHGHLVKRLAEVQNAVEKLK